jgi:hypothetical protein
MVNSLQTFLFKLKKITNFQSKKKSDILKNKDVKIIGKEGKCRNGKTYQIYFEFYKTYVI